MTANAREQLSAFIKGAKRELLIYDSKISDRAMIRLLRDRARAGVAIRKVGRIACKNNSLDVRKLPQTRLHTRTIVRDHRLPDLPRELDYRIVGCTLVLRDVEASLIVDYIPGAIPSS